MPDDNIIQFRKKDPQPDGRRKPPPMLNIPPATKILSGLLILIFLLVWIPTETFFPNLENYAVTYGSLIPSSWTGGEPFLWRTPFTLLTFSLLHAGWMHLGVNILMLVAIGSGLERSIGIKKYLIIYFVSTIFAAFSHLACTPFSTMPIVGASGGISGLFGAMLYLMHVTRDREGNGQNSRFMPIVMVYIAITVISGYMGAPDGSPIAWVAHIGGFLAGIGIMMTLLKQQK